MKFLILTFLAVIFSKTSTAQTNANRSCRLIVDTRSLNIDRNKTKLIIKRDPEEDTIAIAKLSMKQPPFIIHTAEPIFAHVELVLDSTMLAMSSSFIVTNNLIKIKFDSLTKEPKISGGENEFYYRHRFLLFSLPGIIANTPQFNTSLLKNSYDPQIPDLRTRLYYREFENNVIEVVSEHRNYYFILQKLLDKRDLFSLKTLEKCYSLFADTLKNTSKGIELKRYIQQSKKLFIDQVAPQFNVRNENDVKLNSSSIYSNSQFIMVDFWASWCVPCRAQMKEFKNIYRNIDTSKFQIVSVSIDRNKKSWLQAKEEENTPWKNYYDSGGSEGEVSKVFNIDYIPQNRIIDPTGKIVAFDLSSEELIKFLKEHGFYLKE